MLSLRANAATGYRLPIFAQLHQSLSQQQIGLALWEQVGRALILSLPLFLRPDSLQEGLALLQILWAAWILDSIGGGIMVLAGALSRIGPARDAAQEDQASRQPLPHFRGEIRLQGVTFRYNPGGPAILQGLNFHLRPGECLAIVGETGCGKSTLARLLLAYEVPEAGRLFYDDHPAETLDLSSVRAQIGMVWQDSRLWPGSVKSNLLGQQHLPLSAAWEAARLACIDDLIRDLAMHMMTSLDEGGGIFSKGQQQRLLLARALVHRPRLLILDEALGAIDEATRQKIEANLRALGISRLMIAYRPEEVKTADRVLFMEAGRVVAEGTYAALAASHPGFRRLLLASADSPAAASIPHGAPAPPNSPPIDR
jgi:ABC-type bacteriocin/lantibiotic exporter with double-glycine peptidase domain